MKKISLILLMFVTLSFWACEADKEKVFVNETLTSNVLSNLDATSLALSLDTKADTFQIFSWTAVDYGFQAVATYTVQMDVKGNSFAAPKDVVTVTGKLEAPITIGDFNKLLLNFLDPDVAATLQFRVKAVLHATIPTVYSNIVEATVTPYATSFPPIYMIGSSTGGWDPNLAVELRSSAPSVYTTIAYFSNTPDNNTFRFFKAAAWGDSWNFPYFTGGAPSALLINALDGDLNFRFIGTSGYYSITANFKTKTVEMVAVDEPVMFMTGDGVGSGAWGWNPGQYVAMTWKRNGVWEATTNFNNGGAFRFFAQTGWSTSYNYPYFADGTVTALLSNANDGDKNFRVVATSGTYKITVNLLDKIVSMEAGK